MNYIKALKIYNDRKGEKNEWCVYKKGTPEYLEVIKIMKDFKEKSIKKEEPINNELEKIRKRKNEVYKMINDNIKDEKIKYILLSINRNIKVIEYCISKINDNSNTDKSSYISRANNAINLSNNSINKLEEYLKTKPIKEKAVNVISNNFKIKQAKQELEKLKLEKEKEEAKNELDKLKLEKERKEFKKDKLFNIDDEQSLNIYNAVKNSGLKSNKTLINSLIIDTKNIIEYKKKILTTTKYDDFLNFKRLIERDYKDIKQGEIILNKELNKEESNPQANRIMKEKKREENPEPKPEPKIIEIPEKSKNISSNDYIDIQENLDRNIEKYLPLYLPLFNINDLLGLLKFSRTDIKKLNIFLTPQSIADELIDYSFIIEQYTYDKNYDNNIIYDILEPTAGTGNLISELIEYINPKNLKIDAVERENTLYNIGKARFNNFDNIKWYNENFLTFKPNKKYDYIFMNPPFNINIGNKQYFDIDFINEAYKLLKEDGKICAIISSSYLNKNTPKHKKFKDFIDNKGGVEVYELNEGFKEDKTISKEMQTKIKMMIVIIDKQEEIESIL